MRFGATTAYAQNFASIGDDMREVRPTFAACVPRFFEKIYARVLDEVSRSSTAKRLVFEAAIRAAPRTRSGGRASIEHALFERFVYRKVRARLGGQIRFLISGGAALNKEIAEFFYIIGIPILEGYGLTETSPVIALNALGSMRIGTVGRPVDGVEIQIVPDGEVLVRGPNVMKGYYKKPRETQEALRGGWLHTGDIGSLDAEGFLTITDRKKDLIVMSNGKKVAPQPIENRLRLIPYFENVLIIGDHRNFISALVVPDYAALAAFARHHGITFENPRELVNSRDVYDLLMQEIERRTSDLSNFEKIKKFAFVESPFTLENEEMTPTMKIRRSVVQQKYRSTIDNLYAA
jgi:long-chain acyl-CoA synthetase